MKPDTEFDINRKPLIEYEEVEYIDPFVPAIEAKPSRPEDVLVRIEL